MNTALLSTSEIEESHLLRGEGVNASERYLSQLCQRSFLSLWSYSGIHRDQGKTPLRKIGKELCDLLVVFENHIIIFSDKYCAFPNTGDINLDWSRWYRRTVQESAQQLWGAERWIREHPDRLFLDPACLHPFPFLLPVSAKAKVHRVLVAHGAARRCQNYYGGSGSLMIDTMLIKEAHYTPAHPQYRPFSIGNIDPTKGYIHIFDDTTLDIVLSTLDTVSDFVTYLTKKEKLIIERDVQVFAAGEEDILAFYLQTFDRNKEHDFIFPHQKKLNAVCIEEGLWTDFVTSDRKKIQEKANRISYAWDGLIETFIQNTTHTLQSDASHTTIKDIEQILRLMAREGRVRRRLLAQSLRDIITKTEPSQRGTRVTLPSNIGDPHYVFLLLPHLASISDEEYRDVRIKLLRACCLIVKLKFPNALDVIGIATESGRNIRRSEDAFYLDARYWDTAMHDEAVSWQNEIGILTTAHPFFGTVYEYPSGTGDDNEKTIRRSKFTMKGRSRNASCICGSGKKFKHCCGNYTPR